MSESLVPVLTLVGAFFAAYTVALGLLACATVLLLRRGARRRQDRDARAALMREAAFAEDARQVHARLVAAGLVSPTATLHAGV